MKGTLTLTHLGWFITTINKDFGLEKYPLYYSDLFDLSIKSNIKLDDRHGQTVDFVLIDVPSPITTNPVTYASITKLYDETIIHKLRNHLNNITPEQFEKEIEQIEEEGFTSGPTMKEFINNMDKTEPRQSYQYGMTSAQHSQFEHFRNRLNDFTSTIHMLCNQEQPDITYGFELGRLWREISDITFEIMKLDDEIRRQSDVK